MKASFKKVILLVAVIAMPALTMAAQDGSEDGEGRPPRDPAFKVAIEKCAADNGITLPDPGQHQRPAKEDMEKIKACMTEAGYTMPDHPHRHHPRDSASVSPGAQ